MSFLKAFLQLFEVLRRKSEGNQVSNIRLGLEGWKQPSFLFNNYLMTHNQTFGGDRHNKCSFKIYYYEKITQQTQNKFQIKSSFTFFDRPIKNKTLSNL
jgi:hypothetical protein